MQRLLMGNSIIRLHSVDSTNNHAKWLLKKNKSLAEGTVIIADSQEQGRGQYGNNWVTESGKNLTFSIILYPKFLKASEQFLLNQAICLGLVECIQTKVSQQVSIKWPNDILVERKKVCGILIENNIMKDALSESIIGIGLNVNQTDFPISVLNATSLKLISNNNIDLEELLQELLGCIEKYYLKIMHGQKDFIREHYLQILYQYKKNSDFRINNEVVQGVIEGVNQLGQLEITINGERKVFNNKEVAFLL